MKNKNRYKIYTFPNGATLLYRKSRIKKYKGTALTAGFRRGSEQDTIPGITHFMEHQFLFDTKNRTRQNILDFMNDNASINAETSPAYVRIFSEFSNKLTKQTWDILSDCLLNTEYKTKNLNSERGVIHEELNQKLNAFKKNIDLNHYALIQRLQYPYPKNLGTHESIDKITVSNLNKYREKIFKSNYFIISAFSSLPFYKIKKLAQNYFVNKLNETKDAEPNNLSLDLVKPDALQVLNSNDVNVKCNITFACDLGINNCNNIAGHRWVFDALFKDNVSLFYYLRSKGLIYSQDYTVDYFNNSSFYTFYFQTSKEKFNDVIKGIGEYLHFAYNNRIDEERFKQLKLKDKIANDIIIKKPPTPMNICKSNFSCFVTNDYDKKLNYEKLDKKLTTYDVHEFVQNLFNEESKLYITIMGDVKEKDFPKLDEFRKILVGGLKKPARLNKNV